MHINNCFILIFSVKACIVRMRSLRTDYQKIVARNNAPSGAPAPRPLTVRKRMTLRLCAFLFEFVKKEESTNNYSAPTQSTPVKRPSPRPQVNIISIYNSNHYSIINNVNSSVIIICEIYMNKHISYYLIST